jgi:hypothetical protein
VPSQLRECRIAGGFFRSAEVFARKWSHRLPIATPCVIIDRGSAVHVLGNATAAPRSIAYALTNHGSNRQEARISRNAVGLLPAGYVD